MKNSRYQKTKQGWVIRVPNPTDFDQNNPKTKPDFINFRQKMVISMKKWVNFEQKISILS